MEIARAEAADLSVQLRRVCTAVYDIYVSVSELIRWRAHGGKITTLGAAGALIFIRTLLATQRIGFQMSRGK